MKWFKKKPQLVPQRIDVTTSDRHVATHYANYRTLKSDGTLTLHDGEGGSLVVADYAPGHWLSSVIVDDLK